MKAVRARSRLDERRRGIHRRKLSSFLDQLWFWRNKVLIQQAVVHCSNDEGRLTDSDLWVGNTT